ncbi:MAG: DNA cytosine methyltransferase [Gammaproteobacteria bacterium]|nr:DNA cytosine methyltransferase [Gammaproteobacteria bacterium]MBU1731006.1 DNA cytosine methyltransferase [Gammaproteobacteria bacterium]MBU1893666.1 DNA cytosine methyltransferase [Gammaproteobacteria bacterium]
MKTKHVEIRHFHLFCGLGGGAAGFNNGEARVGNMQARFRCIGGVDVDPAGVRDFQKLSGVPGTVLDMFDRDQYTAFHGGDAPAGWREAMPDDIRRAAGNERPHIVFLSAPCKGFSGLLSEGKSKTDKYQALNRLTLRGVWLMLEAFADDLPELVIFENVPRIANRGRHLLDQIQSLLQRYGYATAETTHDCGQIGGLAQSRKRFLMVARNVEKVPHFLYEPPVRPLQSVGSVLGRMPMPGDMLGGPMHRVPALMWKTWVRLAFVEAGSDWRSLNKLAVEDGALRDYLVVPEMRNTVLGVRDWDENTGVVAGRSGPLNGAFSVADPRMPHSDTRHYNLYRVIAWDKTANVVAGSSHVAGGAMSVADPRSHSGFGGKGKYIVTPFDSPSNTVISGSTTGQGAFAVGDPRMNWNENAHSSKLRVTDWDHPQSAITGARGPYTGATAVADPRILHRGKGDHYLTGGHYGVVPWQESCGAVSASACHDNGRWSVADPRMPRIDEKTIAVIRSMDGTWHRPFTTLELAALQGLIDPEDHLELDGLSDQAWRERIGNAVPAPAAQAIASEMGRTLLLAWSGGTMQLALTPIWVRPVAVALSVAQGGRHE